MEFKTFKQVINYMESFDNLEIHTDHYSSRTYRIDRVEAILNHLGNPDKNYKVLHLAGTKGKGSTASFLADGLAALGYKTGKFLSPHVTDYRERFSLNNRFISDKYLIETGNELAYKLKNFHFSGDVGSEGPTSFELYTSFALLLFKNIKCDWVVLETGMGGRLDATNAVIPDAVFLTPIEKEHTKILGKTITAIATEKSKIISKNKPTFISKQPKAALEVFLAEAKAQNSKVYYLPDFLIKEKQELINTNQGLRQAVELMFSDGYKTSLSLKMLSTVQGNNAALALLGLKTLNLYKPIITEIALNNTTLPGRFELLNYKVPMYIDGAHTPHSMSSTLNTFCEIFQEKSRVIVYSNVSGKNYKVMINKVLRCFDIVIITRPGTYKKSDINSIYDYTKSKLKPNQQVFLCPEVKQALLKIEELQATSILVTGSFYLAGLFKEALCQ